MKKILVVLMSVFVSACLLGACGKDKKNSSIDSASESLVSSVLSGSEASNAASSSNEESSSSQSFVESSSMSSADSSVESSSMSSVNSSSDSSVDSSPDSSVNSSSDSSEDSSSDSSVDSSEDSSSDSSEDSSEDSSSDSSVDSSEDSSSDSSVDSSEDSSSDSSVDSSSETVYIYTDFTAEEKAQMVEYIGEVIPFVANNEYYVDFYADEEYDEQGLNFYTFGNTEEEFEVYLGQYSEYVFVESYEDYFGDTCYVYEKGNITVELSYYYYYDEEYNEDVYVIDVYAYVPYTGTIPDEGEGDDIGGGEEEYRYTDFKDTEKNLMLTYIGIELPFVPNNNYTFDAYYYEEQHQNVASFLVFDATEETFNAYIEAYADYQCIVSPEEGEEQPYYIYNKNDVTVVVSYSSGLISVAASKPSNAPGEEGYLFTDFTDEDKALMEEIIGDVIPFIPNNHYMILGPEDFGYNAIGFSTRGNTEEEINAYIEQCATLYTFMESEGVEGYVSDTFILTIAYNAEDTLLTVVAMPLGGGSGEGEYVTTLPNDGRGLPSSESGIYEVDFTKAEYVKDVHDQGYYLDGCPTVSGSEKLNILVIPVEFKDATAESKGYDIEKIERAFNGGEGDTDYYSVREYNYISSYGQLDLNFVVLDSWFRPQQSSTYYAEYTTVVQDTELAIGDQVIMNEALQYLAPIMDLAQFDSDGNGTIDGIVMINTLAIDSEVDFQWAYRYWNYYWDNEGNPYEYDGVYANDYLWAPYQFLHEDRSTGEYDSSLTNTYTFIHEFGHLLGADDYYDTAYIEHPMGGYDIMDAMIADHNPFTKFNYGWLTSSRLIVAEESVTVTLDAFSKNGDTIIIANNWAEELGAYQEYYVLMYYTNEGLNTGEYGLFEEEGILVYHVNATLYVDESYGDPLYDIYNSNTNYWDPNGYGTLDNLIEFVTTESGEYVYGVGDSLASDTMNDSNEAIAYTFTVDSITSDSATLTFTKNA